MFFLSYARADDAEFVRNLYTQLIADGHEGWFDLQSMPDAGREFTVEIEDAISRSDWFIVILGPAALRSEVVRKEREWARREGKATIPLLRLGKPEDYPMSLQRLNLIDFRVEANPQAAYDKLSNALRLQPAPLGTLHRVPELPSTYVSDLDRLEFLKEELRGDLGSRPWKDNRKRIVALHGMGGSGKTLAAAELAWDPDVRRLFPDGIYWVPLGEDVHVVREQQRLARALGARHVTIQSPKGGRSLLISLLQHKRTLLVLDDAWKREHLYPFCGLGSRCAALITTRYEPIAKEFGGTTVAILPSDEQSRQILAVNCGLPPTELPREAIEFANLCEGLPLALAIAGRMVGDGLTTWPLLIGSLKSNNVSSLEHDQGSVFASLSSSLRPLEEEERIRLAELSAFPPGTDIPELIVHRLWSKTAGLDVAKSTHLLGRLVNLALLRVRYLSEGMRQLQMHDLLRTYLLANDVYADRYRSANDALLASYETEWGERWEEMPDDGHFPYYLPWRLVQAHRFDDLQRLLHAKRFGFLDRWISGGEGDQALEVLPSLIAFLQNRNKPADRYHSLGWTTQLARVESLRGDFDAAERNFKEVLKRASWRMPDLKAIALHELGSISLYRDRRREAQSYFAKALTFSLTPWHVSTAEVGANLLSLATLAAERYQFSRALYLTRLSRIPFKMVGDRSHLLASFITASSVHKAKGRYQRSTQLIQKVERSASDLGFRNLEIQAKLLRGWLVYGKACLGKTDFAEAQSDFELAKDLAHSHAAHYSTCEAIVGECWCALALLDSEKACELLEELDEQVRDEFPSVQLGRQIAQASLSLMKQRHEEAEQGYLEADAYCESSGDKIWRPSALTGLGVIQWRKGDKKAAEVYFNQAIKVAATVSSAKRRLAKAGIQACKTSSDTVPR